MTARSPIGLVDKLADLAAGAEPPPLDDNESRRFVDRAMAMAAVRQPVRRPLGWMLAAAAVVIASVTAVVLHHTDPTTVVAAEPLHLTLPTGDRLTGVAGAQFDVDQLAPDDRKLRLYRGIVLFDVAHVVSGQRFQVTTAHLIVTAKGTVFSVETDATSSLVRVYEGAVEIEQDAHVVLLAAGGVWDSRTRIAGTATEPPAALATSVELAVRDHAASAMVDPAHVEPAHVEPAHVEPSHVEPSHVDAPSPAAISAREPSPPDLEPLDHLFETARDDVVAGRLDHALALVSRAAARGPLSGPWWQLSGDALRGLKRAAEAANAYDAAADALSGAEHVEAGYSAAYVRFHDLHDATTALASLDLANADARGSPLEERALALRAQILVSLGRLGAARSIAVRYLDEFPKADLATYMQSLTRLTN